MTRIALINHALDQAGLDSSFQTKARTWLNTVLEKLSIRTNYKFYRKKAETAWVSGQKAYNLPADYQRSDSCFMLDPAGNPGQAIPIVEPYEFDMYTPGSSSGTPVMATIDLDAGTIIFSSAPSDPNGRSYRLWYFRDPPTYSTDTTDDSVVPDFEDQETLIQELILMAYQFREDEREAAQERKLKETKAEFQRNMFESDGTSVMPLNSFVFRNGRRRGRRSGFGG